MWVSVESGPDWESSELQFGVSSKVVLRLPEKFIFLRASLGPEAILRMGKNMRDFHDLDKHDDGDEMVSISAVQYGSY